LKIPYLFCAKFFFEGRDALNIYASSSISNAGATELGTSAKEVYFVF